MAKVTNSMSFQSFNVNMTEGIITEFKKDGEFPYSIKKLVSSFGEDSSLSISIKNIKREHLYQFLTILDGVSDLGLSIKLENGLDELMPDEEDSDESDDE